MKKAFVAINPIAGGSRPDWAADRVSNALADAGWTCDILRTGGEERARGTFRGALPGDYGLAIAVGGDGTVGALADSLVHHDVPLGIIPAGTGNGIAKELGIPLQFDLALRAIIRAEERIVIDAMAVRGEHFFLAIGIGFSALTVKGTGVGDKRRFGMLAYFWRGLQRLIGIQPHAFEIDVDGTRVHLGGMEALVLNAASFGEPYLRWATQVRINDGALETMVFRTQNLVDVFSVAVRALVSQRLTDQRLLYMHGGRSISVHTNHPLPVQGDGDVIGMTPVKIQVVPAAVPVIVPHNSR
jgi:diacylglycerol kinase (ATP)